MLEAAKQCFITDGFHAASMSDIATRAGVSQGLLYRYFENKRAIILAIIEMQLAENREALEGVQITADLVGDFGEAYGMWGRGDPAIWNAGLFSEITAENTRDPLVAEVLRRSERDGRDDFIAWLRRRDALNSRESVAEDLELRAVLMQILVEGLSIRAAREPDLDPKVIQALLQRVLPLALDG